MLSLVKIKEIQMGFIIAIACFFLLLFSNIEVHMMLTHALVIIILCFLLIIFLLQLRMIIAMPRTNKLRVLDMPDKYQTAFKMIFFFIYFTITTIAVGLMAESIGDNRAYNIFLISLFVTNIYNLLVITMINYNFAILSEKKDNQR